MCVLLACAAQKDPPDPLEGVPDQPDVVDETGFSRAHDRDFERNWHVVALQRDETQEQQEEIIRKREEVCMIRRVCLSGCLYCGFFVCRVWWSVCPTVRPPSTYRSGFIFSVFLPSFLPSSLKSFSRHLVSREDASVSFVSGGAGLILVFVVI